MRRVPRLEVEPEGLRRYRADHPEDAQAPGSEAQGVWNRFKDDPAYKEVRDELFRLQGGLCGYCEQRLTTEGGEIIKLDQQVEHVEPKSGAAGATLDWQVLMACCAGGTSTALRDTPENESRRYQGDTNVSCGQTKGNLPLGPGCDPRTFPVAPRVVRIDIGGTLRADADGCKAAGIDPGELDRMIEEVLNLNCDRLRRARDKVRSNLEAIIDLNRQELRVDRFARPGDFETMLFWWSKMRLQPDESGFLREFWTCDRQYLEPVSTRWIAENHALLGWPAP